MCKRVQCPTCERPTYAGCGNHVEQVLGDVAPDQRCHCQPTPRSSASGGMRSWWQARSTR